MLSQVENDVASYVNVENNHYVGINRGSILRIVNPQEIHDVLWPQGRLMFGCHINKLGLCCGVRELALFQFWNGLNANPELAAETVACIKAALVDHAENYRWSLAHLTLTRLTKHVNERDYLGNGPGQIKQPQWFINMLNEWEGATHSEWIKNRNTSNDIQMWTLPISFAYK